MNYSSHYDRLIERAKTRTLVGYLERHHIVPRCLGGKNISSNIAKLTAGEHLLAHRLLARMYPDCPGLQQAVTIMGADRYGHRINNKIFEADRKRHGANLRNNLHSPEAIAKSAASRKGLKRSPATAETIFKIKTARARQGPTNLGRVFSTEARANMSKGSINQRPGFKQTEETKMKMRATWAAKRLAKEMTL